MEGMGDLRNTKNTLSFVTPNKRKRDPGPNYPLYICGIIVLKCSRCDTEQYS